MSKAPVGVDQGELTIVARNVLLDGRTALSDHLDALTVVGAQAVYLRTQGARLATAAYTSDGGLGLDPAVLGSEPLIQQRLREAGFELLDENQPGLWARKATSPESTRLFWWNSTCSSVPPSRARDLEVPTSGRTTR